VAPWVANVKSAPLEANGIVLIKEAVRCADMDAVSRWQSGRPYILLSEDKHSVPPGAAIALVE
jgi:hypothetical protein